MSGAGVEVSGAGVEVSSAGMEVSGAGVENSITLVSIAVELTVWRRFDMGLSLEAMMGVSLCVVLDRCLKAPIDWII